MAAGSPDPVPLARVSSAASSPDEFESLKREHALDIAEKDRQINEWFTTYHGCLAELTTLQQDVAAERQTNAALVKKNLSMTEERDTMAQKGQQIYRELQEVKKTDQGELVSRLRGEIKQLRKREQQREERGDDGRSEELRKEFYAKYDLLERERSRMCTVNEELSATLASRDAELLALRGEQRTHQQQVGQTALRSAAAAREAELMAETRTEENDVLKQKLVRSEAICSALTTEAEGALALKPQLEARACAAEERADELAARVAELENVSWTEERSNLQAELEERSRLVDTWCAKAESLEAQLRARPTRPAPPVPSSPETGWGKVDRYVLPLLRMLSEREPLRQLFLAHLAMLYFVALLWLVKVETKAAPTDVLVREKSLVP